MKAKCVRFVRLFSIKNKLISDLLLKLLYNKYSNFIYFFNISIPNTLLLIKIILED